MRKLFLTYFALTATLLFLVYSGYIIIKWYISAREENESFTVSVTVNNRMSESEVSAILLKEWLERFKSRRYVSRLYDYKVDNIKIEKINDEYFVLTSIYLVKPDANSTWKNLPYIVSGDWIKLKSRFQVNKVNSTYYLVMLPDELVP